MELLTCPHCKVEVAVAANGICPSCRRNVAEAPEHVAENPYRSPQSTQAAGDGLTTGEKIYAAFVIVWAGFLLMSLASIYFLIIPGAENPGVFHFVASAIWLMVLALAVTTGLNLYHRSLLVIPTIVQCLVLCLMVYLIPFGIWGGVLLYRRIQRERTWSEPLTART